jgi:hypothetical protein
MPSVSGKDLISDITEKAGRRLIVLSSIVILVKLYKVDLADMSILGLSLPSELFDVVSLCLVLYMIYVLVINWLGDLVAYRLWYSESEIWSQFNTNMKLDGSFIKGGTALLQKIFALEKGSKWPERFEDIPEDIRKEYQDFKTNSELYICRLDAAGQRFSALSKFASFYVWFQAFVLPMMFAGAAIVLLISCGSFLPPNLGIGT